MEFSHTPVLYEECLALLDPHPDGIYVDATLGGGGHAEGICRRLSPQGIFIGIDRDEDAIRAATKRLEACPCSRYFYHRTFSGIKGILTAQGLSGIDGALMDLGVSSFQLDEAGRGFSYKEDAPLDMRMDRRADFCAEDVVNHYEEERLASVIHRYGEERFARRIARAIVQARKDKPIHSTGELADIVKGAIPAATRREGPHPAKRTFQAIRIEVNDELGELERALDAFIDCLKPGGRLLVISFHSLEDRIVKQTFVQREHPADRLPKGLPVKAQEKAPEVRRINRKPITASADEIAKNPRARSAKLRVLEKTGAPGEER